MRLPGNIRVLLVLGVEAIAGPLLAGFASTEVFLPAVGRAPGAGGAQIYTTVWATNLTSAPETFTFHFLKQGQSNATAAAPIARSQTSAQGSPSPASFSDTLAPGETKVYENVVESMLGLSGVIGAARIVSSGEIFVAERIFNQSPGDDLGKTEGMFFTGVPKGFSISAGQSASVQAVDQGGSENFRTNFVLVETGGGSPTVNVQVFDGSGTMLGQKAYPLLPYEQILPNVGDVVPGIATTNARITATVTGGTGSAILALAQIANESQDPSGAEMTFRDGLLGGAGGTGLTAVIHDSTLLGDGTNGSPLGVNPGSVVAALNGLHGSVTLSAGSNVTITPSGSSLMISSSGGGGGLALPFSGSTDAADVAFSVTDTAGGTAIQGISNVSGNTVTGVYGECKYGYGVYGNSTASPGVDGNSAGAEGVRGTSSADYGVSGQGAKGGVAGYAASTGYGVYGQAAKPSDYGLYAQGSVGATGTKTFVEPHPTDPTKEIRYVCLEGPESGTYFRGTGRLVGGFATIAVPEDFRTVSTDKGLTVQLTPLGAPASLWVVSEDLDRITVRGSGDVEFHYMVNGVRKAFDDFQPISENRDFVPSSPDDKRFTVGLPAESVRRLKANGILNADGTINLETAHRMGWDQQESWKPAASRDR